MVGSLPGWMLGGGGGALRLQTKQLSVMNRINVSLQS
jgi:hypothetical protein